MDKLGYLSRINIMEVLPEATLLYLEQVVPMATVPRGTLLMEPGSRQDILYLLKEGRVRVYKMNPDGKEFTIALLGPGNIFGEVGSFSTGTHNCFAEAIDETLICLARKPDVDKLLQEHPALALRLVELLSARLRQSQELLGYLAMGDVRSRLLYLLLRLAAEFGADDDGPWTLISADLTHQDLAAMIGSSRETVSATLSALFRDGLVRTGRKELWVHREQVRAELDQAL